MIEKIVNMQCELRIDEGASMGVLRTMEYAKEYFLPTEQALQLTRKYYESVYGRKGKDGE